MFEAGTVGTKHELTPTHLALQRSQQKESTVWWNTNIVDYLLVEQINTYYKQSNILTVPKMLD